MAIDQKPKFLCARGEEEVPYLGVALGNSGNGAFHDPNGKPLWVPLRRFRSHQELELESTIYYDLVGFMVI